MAFGGEPLLDKNDDEEGGHREVDARRVEGHQLADRRAEHPAHDPVALVEGGDQQVELPPVAALGRLDRAEQRVGLVGEREDEVGLLFPEALELVDEGEPVEGVARLNGERDDRRLRQPHPAGEQFDEHELHRPGIDGQAAPERPKRVVPRLLKQQAERHADKDVAEKDRRRRGERGAQGFTGILCHGNNLETSDFDLSNGSTIQRKIQPQACKKTARARLPARFFSFLHRALTRPPG